MASFGFAEMQNIQRELQEKYFDQWGGLSPERGREWILWMMGEVGEVIDVLKKNGEDKIMEDPEVRRHFIEELCDVMMYFNDLMICYGITPEELEQVYLEKHRKNMSRW